MGYRNKTYVCFDADTDIHYYRLMTAWKEHEHIAFDFHNAHDLNNLRAWSSEATIKAKLRERLESTKVLVVLVGESTRHLFKFVRWEIEYAIEKNIPIICVNLNGARQKDDRCPPLLKGELAVFVPFGQKILNYALNDWPASHQKYRNEGKSGDFYYYDWVYTDLGL